MVNSDVPFSDHAAGHAPHQDTRGPKKAPLFLVLIGSAGLALVLLALVREGPRRASGEEPMDFVQYYFTGWRLAQGLPAYDPITIDGELARTVGWQHANVLRTGNPPALVCLTWPLALVAYPVAWWGLSIGSLITLAVVSWIAARHSGWDRPGATAWAALAAGSAPTLTFVILNHIEAPILLLGVGGWLCLRGGRPGFGAGMWGLAAALKLFPAFWLIALLRTRHRRAAILGFAAAAAFTALGAAIIGWDDTATFLRMALPQSKAWESDVANMSVRSLGNDLLGRPGGIALTAATAFVLLWAIFSASRSVDRLWCLGFCGSLLLSPLSWSYYMVLAVPVAALVSSRMDLSNNPARTMFAICIAALFFWPSLLGKWMPGAEVAASWGWPWVLLRHVPTFGLAALAWAGHRHLGDSGAPARNLKDIGP